MVIAAQRARESGCPGQIVDLVIGMYQGPRRIRTQGASSEAILGDAGLVAGCSFAKDFLKAFLKPARHAVTQCRFRDYVDDIALTCTGREATQVARELATARQQVGDWLTQNNMVLNEAKEQVWAPDAATRNAWEGLPGPFRGGRWTPSQRSWDLPQEVALSEHCPPRPDLETHWSLPADWYVAPT